MEEKDESQACFPYWPQAKEEKLKKLEKENQRYRKEKIKIIISAIRLLIKINRGLTPTQEQLVKEMDIDICKIRQNDPNFPLYNCFIVKLGKEPNRRTVKCTKCYASSMYKCPLIPRKAK